MIASWEHQLIQLYNDILAVGESRADRTGTGTISIFGDRLKIDLREGFPLVTTKAMALKPVISELLWFCEGSGDERRLAEIHHGTRDESKRTIWSPNADDTTGAKYKPLRYGDLGEVYGVQWRSWPTFVFEDYDDFLLDSKEGTQKFFGATVEVGKIDQLANLIEGLKTNPHGRRHILSAWNVGRLDNMVLPPCHMFSQFYVSNDGHLHCQMYQRSVDTFLGLPFNVASYAALTHMLAHLTGYKAGVLTMVLGDTHIYMNHLDQVKLQVQQPLRAVPKLKPFREDIKSIEDFKLSDFILEGYIPGIPIKGDMSA